MIRKRGEDDYKVRKYETPVETFPISNHRSTFRIGIKMVRLIRSKLMMPSDFSDGMCLQRTHKYENSNYAELNMETTYLKM